MISFDRIAIFASLLWGELILFCARSWVATLLWLSTATNLCLMPRRPQERVLFCRNGYMDITFLFMAYIYLDEAPSINGLREYLSDRNQRLDFLHLLSTHKNNIYHVTIPINGPYEYVGKHPYSRSVMFGSLRVADLYPRNLKDVHNIYE